LICHTLVFAVSATDDCAIHDGDDDNCRSLSVTSGVTLNVPDELPLMLNAVFPPLRQSKFDRVRYADAA
jgi:hypothetical protein